MVRPIVLLAGTLLFAATCAPIPLAGADDPQGVRTESGRVRCYVTANDAGHGGGPLVVCQQDDARPFPQAPISPQYNEQMNHAVVRGTGAFNWDIGNIPGSPQAEAKDIVLKNYGQTYHINGWTIFPSSDGTRFVNDRTGHGMFVSIENVYSF
jgi:hypothetical protein